MMAMKTNAGRIPVPPPPHPEASASDRPPMSAAVAKRMDRPTPRLQGVAGAKGGVPDFLDRTAGKTSEEIAALRRAATSKTTVARTTVIHSPGRPGEESEMTKKVKSAAKAAGVAAKSAKKAKGAKRTPAGARKAAGAGKVAKTKNGATDGPRAGSKAAIIGGLLRQKGGTTVAEVLKATGWPTVSMPAQARAAGVGLRKEKIDGVGRYFAA